MNYQRDTTSYQHRKNKSSYRVFLWLIPMAFLFHFNSFAQFADDFETGQLSTEWLGDRHAFTIDKGELKLDTVDSGTADLYRFVNFPDSFFLEGYFHLDFAPSASNKLNIYFMTDNADPSLASGYYMSVGEGGSADALEIFRLDSGVETLLWRGEDGSMAANPAVTYSLHRSPSGQWRVYLALEKDAVPVISGSFIDDSYSPGENMIFHLQCNYTASRSKHFYFDDLTVREDLPDTIPPVLISHKLSGGKNLLLQYNEFLSGNSLKNENFSIPGTLVESVKYGADSSEIILDFAEDLPVGEEQTLLIKNIEDLAGNIASDTEVKLLYLAARPPVKGELLITEILPAPRNNGFLPNYEYTEIYNNSPDYLELKDIYYTDGSSGDNLPDYILGPGEFAIVCSRDAAVELAEYGTTLGLNRFPAQVDAGDDIYLLLNGEVIDELHYNDVLFGGSSFRSNGYSLELQNLYDLCADASAKWGPSQADIKASPGKKNSIWETEGEISQVEYHYFRMPADQLLEIVFNKSLNTELNNIDVSISPAIGINELFITGNVLKVSIEHPMDPELDYLLSIKKLSDCSLRGESDFTIPIAAPAESPVHGDIILNEVLLDPATRTEQYLEIKNCSDYAVNLSELIFVSYKNEIKETFYKDEDRIMLPDEILVLSKAPADISGEFEIRYPHRLIKVDNFPSLDRTEGSIVLMYNNSQANVSLDSLKYSNKMHIPFLRSTKGVSLERIGCKTDGSSKESWKSAAQSENYGTPTYENSQLRDLSVENRDKLFSLVSPTFSPDGDGFEDILILLYNGIEVAQRSRLEVYDLHGRLVKTILNNNGLSTKDIITWDGSMDDNSIALPGIYLIYAVVYDESGNKRVWKSSCTLAR